MILRRIPSLATICLSLLITLLCLSSPGALSFALAAQSPAQWARSAAQRRRRRQTPAVASTMEELSVCPSLVATVSSAPLNLRALQKGLWREWQSAMEGSNTASSSTTNSSNSSLSISRADPFYLAAAAPSSVSQGGVRSGRLSVLVSMVPCEVGGAPLFVPITAADAARLLRWQEGVDAVARQAAGSCRAACPLLFGTNSSNDACHSNGGGPPLCTASSNSNSSISEEDEINRCAFMCSDFSAEAGSSAASSVMEQRAARVRIVAKRRTATSGSGTRKNAAGSNGGGVGSSLLFVTSSRQLCSLVGLNSDTDNAAAAKKDGVGSDFAFFQLLQCTKAMRRRQLRQAFSARAAQRGRLSVRGLSLRTMLLSEEGLTESSIARSILTGAASTNGWSAGGGAAAAPVPPTLLSQGESEASLLSTASLARVLPPASELIYSSKTNANDAAFNSKEIESSGNGGVAYELLSSSASQLDRAAALAYFFPHLVANAYGDSSSSEAVDVNDTFSVGGGDAFDGGNSTNGTGVSRGGGGGRCSLRVPNKFWHTARPLFEALFSSGVVENATADAATEGGWGSLPSRWLASVLGAARADSGRADVGEVSSLLTNSTPNTFLPIASSIAASHHSMCLAAARLASFRWVVGLSGTAPFEAARRSLQNINYFGDGGDGYASRSPHSSFIMYPREQVVGSSASDDLFGGGEAAAIAVTSRDLAWLRAALVRCGNSSSSTNSNNTYTDTTSGDPTPSTLAQDEADVRSAYAAALRSANDRGLAVGAAEADAAGGSGAATTLVPDAAFEAFPFAPATTANVIAGGGSGNGIYSVPYLQFADKAAALGASAVSAVEAQRVRDFVRTIDAALGTAKKGGSVLGGAANVSVSAVRVPSSSSGSDGTEGNGGSAWALWSALPNGATTAASAAAPSLFCDATLCWEDGSVGSPPPSELSTPPPRAGSLSTLAYLSSLLFGKPSGAVVGSSGSPTALPPSSAATTTSDGGEQQQGAVGANFGIPSLSELFAGSTSAAFSAATAASPVAPPAVGAANGEASAGSAIREWFSARGRSVPREPQGFELTVARGAVRCSVVRVGLGGGGGGEDGASEAADPTANIVPHGHAAASASLSFSLSALHCQLPEAPSFHIYESEELFVALDGAGAFAEPCTVAYSDTSVALEDERYGGGGGSGGWGGGSDAAAAAARLYGRTFAGAVGSPPYPTSLSIDYEDGIRTAARRRSLAGMCADSGRNQYNATTVDLGAAAEDSQAIRRWRAAIDAAGNVSHFPTPNPRDANNSDINNCTVFAKVWPPAVSPAAGRTTVLLPVVTVNSNTAAAASAAFAKLLETLDHPPTDGMMGEGSSSSSRAFAAADSSSSSGDLSTLPSNGQHPSDMRRLSAIAGGLRAIRRTAGDFLGRVNNNNNNGGQSISSVVTVPIANASLVPKDVFLMYDALSTGNSSINSSISHDVAVAEALVSYSSAIAPSITVAPKGNGGAGSSSSLFKALFGALPFSSSASANPSSSSSSSEGTEQQQESVGSSGGSSSSSEFLNDGSSAGARSLAERMRLSADLPSAVRVAGGVAAVANFIAFALDADQSGGPAELQAVAVLTNSLRCSSPSDRVAGGLLVYHLSPFALFFWALSSLQRELMMNELWPMGRGGGSGNGNGGGNSEEVIVHGSLRAVLSSETIGAATDQQTTSSSSTSSQQQQQWGAYRVWNGFGSSPSLLEDDSFAVIGLSALVGSGEAGEGTGGSSSLRNQRQQRTRATIYHTAADGSYNNGDDYDEASASAVAVLWEAILEAVPSGRGEEVGGTAGRTRLQTNALSAALWYVGLPALIIAAVAILQLIALAVYLLLTTPRAARRGGGSSSLFSFLFSPSTSSSGNNSGGVGGSGKHTDRLDRFAIWLAEEEAVRANGGATSAEPPSRRKSSGASAADAAPLPSIFTAASKAEEDSAEKSYLHAANGNLNGGTIAPSETPSPTRGKGYREVPDHSVSTAPAPAGGPSSAPKYVQNSTEHHTDASGFSHSHPAAANTGTRGGASSLPRPRALPPTDAMAGGLSEDAVHRLRDEINADLQDRLVVSALLGRWVKVQLDALRVEAAAIVSDAASRRRAVLETEAVAKQRQMDEAARLRKGNASGNESDGQQRNSNSNSTSILLPGSFGLGGTATPRRQNITPRGGGLTLPLRRSTSVRFSADPEGPPTPPSGRNRNNFANESNSFFSPTAASSPSAPMRQGFGFTVLGASTPPALQQQQQGQQYASTSSPTIPLLPLASRTTDRLQQQQQYNQSEDNFFLRVTNADTAEDDDGAPLSAAAARTDTNQPTHRVFPASAFPPSSLPSPPNSFGNVHASSPLHSPSTSAFSTSNSPVEKGSGGAPPLHPFGPGGTPPPPPASPPPFSGAGKDFVAFATPGGDHAHTIGRANNASTGGWFVDRVVDSDSSSSSSSSDDEDEEGSGGGGAGGRRGRILAARQQRLRALAEKSRHNAADAIVADTKGSSGSSSSSPSAFASLRGRRMSSFGAALAADALSAASPTRKKGGLDGDDDDAGGGGSGAFSVSRRGNNNNINNGGANNSGSFSSPLSGGKRLSFALGKGKVLGIGGGGGGGPSSAAGIGGGVGAISAFARMKLRRIAQEKRQKVRQIQSLERTQKSVLLMTNGPHLPLLQKIALLRCYVIGLSDDVSAAVLKASTAAPTPDPSVAKQRAAEAKRMRRQQRRRQKGGSFGSNGDEGDGPSLPTVFGEVSGFFSPLGARRGGGGGGFGLGGSDEDRNSNSGLLRTGTSASLASSAGGASSNANASSADPLDPIAALLDPKIAALLRYLDRQQRRARSLVLKLSIEVDGLEGGLGGGEEDEDDEGGQQGGPEESLGVLAAAEAAAAAAANDNTNKAVAGGTDDQSSQFGESVRLLSNQNGLARRPSAIIAAARQQEEERAGLRSSSNAGGHLGGGVGIRLDGDTAAGQALRAAVARLFQSFKVLNDKQTAEVKGVQRVLAAAKRRASSLRGEGNSNAATTAAPPPNAAAAAMNAWAGRSQSHPDLTNQPPGGSGHPYPTNAALIHVVPPSGAINNSSVDVGGGDGPLFSAHSPIASARVRPINRGPAADVSLFVPPGHDANPNKSITAAAANNTTTIAAEDGALLAFASHEEGQRGTADGGGVGAGGSDFNLLLALDASVRGSGAATTAAADADAHETSLLLDTSQLVLNTSDTDGGPRQQSIFASTLAGGRGGGDKDKDKEEGKTAEEEEAAARRAARLEAKALGVIGAAVRHNALAMRDLLQSLDDPDGYVLRQELLRNAKDAADLSILRAFAGAGAVVGAAREHQALQLNALGGLEAWANAAFPALVRAGPSGDGYYANSQQLQEYHPQHTPFAGASSASVGRAPLPTAMDPAALSTTGPYAPQHPPQQQPASMPFPASNPQFNSSYDGPYGLGLSSDGVGAGGSGAADVSLSAIPPLMLASSSAAQQQVGIGSGAPAFGKSTPPPPALTAWSTAAGGAPQQQLAQAQQQLHNGERSNSLSFSFNAPPSPGHAAVAPFAGLLTPPPPPPQPSSSPTNVRVSGALTSSQHQTTGDDVNEGYSPIAKLSPVVGDARQRSNSNNLARSPSLFAVSTPTTTRGGSSNAGDAPSGKSRWAMLANTNRSLSMFGGLGARRRAAGAVGSNSLRRGSISVSRHSANNAATPRLADGTADPFGRMVEETGRDSDEESRGRRSVRGGGQRHLIASAPSTTTIIVDGGSSVLPPVVGTVGDVQQTHQQHIPQPSATTTDTQHQRQQSEEPLNSDGDEPPEGFELIKRSDVPLPAMAALRFPSLPARLSRWLFAGLAAGTFELLRAATKGYDASAAKASGSAAGNVIAGTQSLSLSSFSSSSSSSSTSSYLDEGVRAYFYLVGIAGAVCCGLIVFGTLLIVRLRSTAGYYQDHWELSALPAHVAWVLPQGCWMPTNFRRCFGGAALVGPFSPFGGTAAVYWALRDYLVSLAVGAVLVALPLDVASCELRFVVLCFAFSIAAIATVARRPHRTLLASLLSAATDLALAMLCLAHAAAAQFPSPATDTFKFTVMLLVFILVFSRAIAGVAVLFGFERLYLSMWATAERAVADEAERCLRLRTKELYLMLDVLDSLTAYETRRLVAAAARAKARREAAARELLVSLGVTANASIHTGVGNGGYYSGSGGTSAEFVPVTNASFAGLGRSLTTSFFSAPSAANANASSVSGAPASFGGGAAPNASFADNAGIANLLLLPAAANNGGGLSNLHANAAAGAASNSGPSSFSDVTNQTATTTTAATTGDNSSGRDVADIDAFIATLSPEAMAEIQREASGRALTLLRTILEPPWYLLRDDEGRRRPRPSDDDGSGKNEKSRRRRKKRKDGDNDDDGSSSTSTSSSSGRSSSAASSVASSTLSLSSSLRSSISLGSVGSGSGRDIGSAGGGPNSFVLPGARVASSEFDRPSSSEGNGGLLAAGGGLIKDLFGAIASSPNPKGSKKKDGKSKKGSGADNDGSSSDDDDDIREIEEIRRRNEERRKEWQATEAKNQKKDKEKIKKEEEKKKKKKRRQKKKNGDFSSSSSSSSSSGSSSSFSSSSSSSSSDDDGKRKVSKRRNAAGVLGDGTAQDLRRRQSILNRFGGLSGALGGLDVSDAGDDDDDDAANEKKKNKKTPANAGGWRSEQSSAAAPTVPTIAPRKHSGDDGAGGGGDADDSASDVGASDGEDDDAKAREDEEVAALLGSTSGFTAPISKSGPSSASSSSAEDGDGDDERAPTPPRPPNESDSEDEDGSTGEDSDNESGLMGRSKPSPRNRFKLPPKDDKANAGTKTAPKPAPKKKRKRKKLDPSIPPVPIALRTEAGDIVSLRDDGEPVRSRSMAKLLRIMQQRREVEEEAEAERRAAEAEEAEEEERQRLLQSEGGSHSPRGSIDPETATQEYDSDDGDNTSSSSAAAVRATAKSKGSGRRLSSPTAIAAAEKAEREAAERERQRKAEEEELQRTKWRAERDAYDAAYAQQQRQYDRLVAERRDAEKEAALLQQRQREEAESKKKAAAYAAAVAEHKAAVQKYEAAQRLKEQQRSLGYGSSDDDYEDGDGDADADNEGGGGDGRHRQRYRGSAAVAALIEGFSDDDSDGDGSDAEEDPTGLTRRRRRRHPPREVAAARRVRSAAAAASDRSEFDAYAPHTFLREAPQPQRAPPPLSPSALSSDTPHDYGGDGAARHHPAHHHRYADAEAATPTSVPAANAPPPRALRRAIGLDSSDDDDDVHDAGRRGIGFDDDDDDGDGLRAYGSGGFSIGVLPSPPRPPLGGGGGSGYSSEEPAADSYFADLGFSP